MSIDYEIIHFYSFMKFYFKKIFFCYGTEAKILYNVSTKNTEGIYETH